MNLAGTGGVGPAGEGGLMQALPWQSCSPSGSPGVGCVWTQCSSPSSLHSHSQGQGSSSWSGSLEEEERELELLLLEEDEELDELDEEELELLLGLGSNSNESPPPAELLDEFPSSASWYRLTRVSTVSPSLPAGVFSASR